MAALKELQKQLGEEYRIRMMDFERCLYRDFGNGYNVEISGISGRKKECAATLYLWFGYTEKDSLIVETVHDVEKTAEAIGRAVDELRAEAEVFLLNGYNAREKLFRLVKAE